MILPFFFLFLGIFLIIVGIVWLKKSHKNKGEYLWWGEEGDFP
tara:strand:- start:79 stop:207 length:129 start_codon:yes stop_codon:yes gene_type:complete